MPVNANVHYSVSSYSEHSRIHGHMDIRAVVGLNVLRIRRERSLSQEELSFQTGFTRAYLSGLEGGRRNPTIVSLGKLADALGVEVRDLVQLPKRTSP